MVLGDAFSKSETFVWILNRISRSITWSLFTLKASCVGNRIMQIRFSLGHVICKLRGPRGKKHGGDVVTKAVQLNQRK